MQSKNFLAIALSFLPLACQSTSARQVVPVDPAKREALFAPLRALEGRWEGLDPSGAPHATEFHLSSAGSALREVMFPGSAREMTNMYTLDGNSVLLTHYCAQGNQPHMRATQLEDGRLAFLSDGVSDLEAEDELYMGSMTLVFVDADHIEQHWKALRGDTVDHEVVFELKRVR